MLKGKYALLRKLFPRSAPAAAQQPTVLGRAARVPRGVRAYAIGDIHGRPDLLAALEEAIVADAEAVAGQLQLFLIYLGDYVDRGGDSRGVIEHLLLPPPAHFERILILGNHDLWMRDFLEGSNVGANWFRFGGDATLASYGVQLDQRLSDTERMKDAQERFLAAVSREHRGFLADLELAFDLGDYYFCHAGIRPSLPLAKQTANDLLWIREPFLSWNGDSNKVIVHGHTISPAPVIKRNRIGIDTGAFSTENLTCLVLEGTTQRFIATS